MNMRMKTMTEKFNIFRWQVDPEYREEIKKQVELDEGLSEEILAMLVSIGEEIGIPFEFATDEPKHKPKVWVDTGNAWNSNEDGWNTL